VLHATGVAVVVRFKILVQYGTGLGSEHMHINRCQCLAAPICKQIVYGVSTGLNWVGYVERMASHPLHPLCNIIITLCMPLCVCVCTAVIIIMFLYLLVTLLLHHPFIGTHKHVISSQLYNAQQYCYNCETRSRNN